MTSFITRHRQIAGALFLAGIILTTIAFLGGLFYVRGRTLMEEELRGRLQSTATIGALLFTGEELDRIKTKGDMYSPLYRDIIARLQRVRSVSKDIVFVYIMRKTDDPMTLSFVADADSLLSFEEADENGNGLIDPEEELSYPGDFYDVSDIPAMQEEAFSHATVDEEITYDQWGALISGYAPVYRSDGSVAGIIGVDMKADTFILLSESMFSGVAFLLVFVLGLMLAVLYFHVSRRRQVELLEQIDNERTGLLQLTMHNLGSLLTIVKWSEEALEDAIMDGTVDKKMVREHSKQVNSGVAELEEVFRGLVAADRLSHESRTHLTQPAALQGAMRAVRSALKDELAARAQKLSVSLERGITVALEKKLLVGVLKELVRNACVYSPKRGTITVRGFSEGSRTVIEVEDKGSGIPEKDLARIFQKFARGSNAERYKPTGNGLGLFIAKTIVERAGGSISLESSEGEGTVVKILM